MRFITLVSAISLLVGCASTNNNYTQTIQGWRGGNTKALLARWGSPQDQATTVNGNTVYVYQTRAYPSFSQPPANAVGVHYTGRGTPVITNTGSAVMNNDRLGGLNLNCSAIFVANKAGQIIDTKTRGTGCYGGSDFTNQYSNPGASR